MCWEKTLDSHSGIEVDRRDHLVQCSHPAALQNPPGKGNAVPVERLQRFSTSGLDLLPSTLDQEIDPRTFPVVLPWQPLGLSGRNTSSLEASLLPQPSLFPPCPPLTFGGLQVGAVQVSNDPSPLASSQLHLSGPSRRLSLCGWVGEEAFWERSCPLRLGSPPRYP